MMDMTTKKTYFKDLPLEGEYSVQHTVNNYTATVYYPDLKQALRYWKKINEKGKFFLGKDLIDPEV